MIDLAIHKAITKKCKVDLVSKFMSEVTTTKLSHQMNPHFWKVVAKSYCI